MSELHLIRLTKEYEREWYDLIAEFSQDGEIVPMAMKGNSDDFDDFLAYADRYATGTDLPGGHVSSDVYFLAEGDKKRLLGAIDIRHELTDCLRQYGGHIGYGVRPSERRKGYAGEMLRLGLLKCRERGMDRILLTCFADNIASARTMKKNGAVLENEVTDNGRLKQRYWIDLQVKPEMEFTYQKATLADLDILTKTRLEVLRAVFKLPEDADLSRMEEASRRYYQESLTTDRHAAYLVFAGPGADGIRTFAGAGGVSFYQVMPTCHNLTGEKAYIMNMYTRPEYRRQGVAGHVLELLIEEAHERGITFITLDASDMGRPVYEKHGFEAMKDEMKLKE